VTFSYIYFIFEKRNKGESRVSKRRSDRENKDAYHIKRERGEREERR
jgi:hypothetical protein